MSAFIVNNLSTLSTIIILIITGATLYFTIRTHLFNFKKPLIQIISALDHPIKYDPVKHPINEKYFRIIVINPSNGNTNIKLEISDEFILSCIRKNKPAFSMNTDNFERTQVYSGDFIMLKSGETVYFDYFILNGKVDSIRAKPITLKLTDSRGRKLKKKFTL